MPPKLPVLSQATPRLLGELAQTQGLLPEGSLDKTALLVWVWCFGEMEVEQEEDYNYRDASEVALRARQQLLAHFIHQSRHFPACIRFFLLLFIALYPPPFSLSIFLLLYVIQSHLLYSYLCNPHINLL